MVHETIVLGFNSNNLMWVSDSGFRKMFIHDRFNYLDVILRKRGYLYMNDIYETYNIEWDPHRENDCFIFNENCDSIRLTELVEDEQCNIFEITVLYKEP